MLNRDVLLISSVAFPGVVESLGKGRILEKICIEFQGWNFRGGGGTAGSPLGSCLPLQHLTFNWILECGPAVFQSSGTTDLLLVEVVVGENSWEVLS